MPCSLNRSNRTNNHSVFALRPNDSNPTLVQEFARTKSALHCSDAHRRLICHGNTGAIAAMRRFDLTRQGSAADAPNLLIAKQRCKTHKPRSYFRKSCSAGHLSILCVSALNTRTIRRGRQYSPTIPSLGCCLRDRAPSDFSDDRTVRQILRAARSNSKDNQQATGASIAAALLVSDSWGDGALQIMMK
jgi:hypothetical protein